MHETSGSLTDLCQALAAELAAADQAPLRVVGFVGPPGAGKSAAMEGLARALGEYQRAGRPLLAGCVPLDGFHKSGEVLQQEGLAARKGAPDSFDVVGYLMTLDRVQSRSMTVYVPHFSHRTQIAVAAAGAVEPWGVALTEGNYLALQDGAWAMVREQVDLLIYLDAPDPVLRERLVARHRERGLDQQAAEQWYTEVDQPNIDLVRASSTRADRLWFIS